MSGIMERTLAILELLVSNPDGLPVSTIADELDIPASAAHRLLKGLSQLGYVRQIRAQGDYALTIRLAALGLNFLGKTGVSDIAQPTLDRLASISRELVRLSVIDYPNLVWVGVAQGATGGLRYDPGRDQGSIVHLASTAGGLAWLSTLSDDEALKLIAAQGVTPRSDAGLHAPKSVSDVITAIRETRERGYSISTDSYHAGMAAMAVPIRRGSDGNTIGCLSIAGPSVRFSAGRMEELLEPLQEAASEIGEASEASFFFNPGRSAPNR